MKFIIALNLRIDVIVDDLRLKLHAPSNNAKTKNNNERLEWERAVRLSQENWEEKKKVKSLITQLINTF